jgi:hypothetical protein
VPLIAASAMVLLIMFPTLTLQDWLPCMHAPGFVWLVIVASKIRRLRQASEASSAQECISELRPQETAPAHDTEAKLKTLAAQHGTGGHMCRYLCFRNSSLVSIGSLQCPAELCNPQPAATAGQTHVQSGSICRENSADRLSWLRFG